MSVSAFTCILHLRKGEESARVLDMLPAERRAVVATELQSVAAHSPIEIRLMLVRLREEQLKAQRQRAQERFHRPLEHASPRFIAWLERPF